MIGGMSHRTTHSILRLIAAAAIGIAVSGGRLANASGQESEIPRDRLYAAKVEHPAPSLPVPAVKPPSRRERRVAQARAQLEKKRQSLMGASRWSEQARAKLTRSIPTTLLAGNDVRAR